MIHVDFYSLASVLHHIQDEELGIAVQKSYNNKDQLKQSTSQIFKCRQIVKNEGKNMLLQI